MMMMMIMAIITIIIIIIITTANCPDIVTKNRRENRSTLIDVAIPSHKNTSLKVSEKIPKCKDLETEIALM